ncbi:MAG: flavodoxin family protein [Candidatus Bathyarchaeia archaeon]|jgi:flavodoxin
MKACVLYISRTGNTKRLAEAIADLLKAPIFNITSAPDPSLVLDFDLLIIGTPVMGLKPAPEVHSFVKRLPNSTEKKTILFCTYAIKQGGTLKVLEKELTTKGYVNVLSVSKRGLKPSKTDLQDVLCQISNAAEPK